MLRKPKTGAKSSSRRALQGLLGLTFHSWWKGLLDWFWHSARVWNARYWHLSDFRGTTQTCNQHLSCQLWLDDFEHEQFESTTLWRASSRSAQCFRRSEVRRSRAADVLPADVLKVFTEHISQFKLRSSTNKAKKKKKKESKPVRCWVTSTIHQITSVWNDGNGEPVETTEAIFFSVTGSKTDSRIENKNPKRDFVCQWQFENSWTKHGANVRFCTNVMMNMEKEDKSLKGPPDCWGSVLLPLMNGKCPFLFFYNRYYLKLEPWTCCLKCLPIYKQ